jgi:hypothetical protein
VRPSDGFEVVPPAVRAERAAIVDLEESTRDAHSGLSGLSGSGGAIGYPDADSAFESMISAWVNVANQLASSIHEFAEATGTAADMYTGTEQSNEQSMVLKAVAPDPPPDVNLPMGP